MSEKIFFPWFEMFPGYVNYMPYHDSHDFMKPTLFIELTALNNNL